MHMFPHRAHTHTHTHTHTHLKVQVAQPVVEIRGDDGFNLFKLVQSCVRLPPEQRGSEPGLMTHNR